MMYTAHTKLMNKKGINRFSMPIPKFEEVEISDIAYSLAGIGRFNGRAKCFFSVGQHSLEVGHLCMTNAERFGLNKAKAALAGLLHDSPEYAYGDLISPTKHMLGSQYHDMKHEADSVIYAALNVTEIMAECNELVRWADLEMLMSDAARWDCFGMFNLLTGDVEITEHGVVPPPFELRYPNCKPMSYGDSAKPFLFMYQTLCRQIFGEKEEYC